MASRTSRLVGRRLGRRVAIPGSATALVPLEKHDLVGRLSSAQLQPLMIVCVCGRLQQKAIECSANQALVFKMQQS